MPFWKSAWMPVLASAGLALTACSSVPLPQACLEDVGVPLFLAPEPGPESFPVKAMKVVEQ